MSTPEEPVALRPATASDWTAVSPLLHAMGKVDSSEAMRTRFQELVSSDAHLLVVALDCDVAVGYAWAQDRGPHLRSGWRSVRIHDLYVVPAQRRRGIGRDCLRASGSGPRHVGSDGSNGKRRQTPWRSTSASASAETPVPIRRIPSSRSTSPVP